MTFGQLIHELECDYGRINFRERLMLRRAYDVVPEKEDKSMCDTCTRDKPCLFRIDQNLPVTCCTAWQGDEE